MTISKSSNSTLCECGCGAPAPIATYTDQQRGWTKGQPKRFISGHNNRQRRLKGAWYTVENRGFATSCWIWQGPRHKGYGRFDLSGRRIMAHRYYYEREYGPLAADVEPDHLCRNKLCVRPQHLQAVSHPENSRRGRGTKLTVPEVREIKNALLAGERHASIAQCYEVAEVTISAIAAGRNWKDVQP